MARLLIGSMERLSQALVMESNELQHQAAQLTVIINKMERSPERTRFIVRRVNALGASAAKSNAASRLMLIVQTWHETDPLNNPPPPAGPIKTTDENGNATI